MSMKMTFDVDDRLYLEFKLTAARHKTSMSKIVNMMIKNFLEEEASVQKRKAKHVDSSNSTDSAMPLAE